MEGVYKSTISTRKRDLLSNCSQKSIKVTRIYYEKRYLRTRQQLNLGA